MVNKEQNAVRHDMWFQLLSEEVTLLGCQSLGMIVHVCVTRMTIVCVPIFFDGTCPPQLVVPRCPPAPFQDRPAGAWQVEAV